jgi:deazaflavin-dependent oxidoreductase (nitroreductase family)
MPLPRSIARFNRRVTNRILGPLAGVVPGFAIVVHVGRKTHRQYRTPVNAFSRPGGYIIALTYGPDSDWVRNVLAAGGCTLEMRGSTIHLTQPHLYHDERRRALPAPVSFVLGLGHVSDFVDLSVQDGTHA